MRKGMKINSNVVEFSEIFGMVNEMFDQCLGKIEHFKQRHGKSNEISNSNVDNNGPKPIEQSIIENIEFPIPYKVKSKGIKKRSSDGKSCKRIPNELEKGKKKMHTSNSQPPMPICNQDTLPPPSMPMCHHANASSYQTNQVILSLCMLTNY